MMNKSFHLVVLRPHELIKRIKETFAVIPMITRDCVKVLNLLLYMLRNMEFTESEHTEIIVLISKGLEHAEPFLKQYMLAAMLDLNSFNGTAGIIAINAIIKEIDNKKLRKRKHIKNLAIRCLFKNLPAEMYSDFEKYIEQDLLEPKSFGNSLIVGSKYLKSLQFSPKITDTVLDYHQSYFTSMPINKYSGMVELNRIREGGRELVGLGNFLGIGTNDYLFLEACKIVEKIKPEIAARFVDLAVQNIRIFLRSSEIKTFLAIRILSHLAETFPTKVAQANREIEDLVSNTNNTISMFATLIIIRTGDKVSVEKLASKLEPLLANMPISYKKMAIDTMESIGKKDCKKYLSFMKRMLKNQGDFEFKRFIMTKLENILPQLDELELKSMLVFLSEILEDSEYNQITMDILGIVGKSSIPLEFLPHIYNRVGLGNLHVQRAAFQTLYQLDPSMETLQTIDGVYCHTNNKPFVDFLKQNSDLKRNEFDIDELNGYQEEVSSLLKPIDESIEEKSEFVPLIKACREIELSTTSDFSVLVVKEIFEEKINLIFTVICNIENVVFRSGRITLDINKERHLLNITEESSVYALDIPRTETAVVNGLLEYILSFKSDLEDTEIDQMQLKPFSVGIFDFIRPIEVHDIPVKEKKITKEFECNEDSTISTIMDITNLHVKSTYDNFILSGFHGNIPVVINVAFDRSSAVKRKLHLKICCDDDMLLDKMCKQFE